jgi:hypothetical protein
MPDTASLGTFHVAETVQLLQSTRPASGSGSWQAGWLRTSVGCTVSTRRAPFPW